MESSVAARLGVQVGGPGQEGGPSEEHLRHREEDRRKHVTVGSCFNTLTGESQGISLVFFVTGLAHELALLHLLAEGVVLLIPRVLTQ